MEFKIDGRRVRLERADVYAALKGQHPRLVGQQRHFVKIRKQEWPAKQALGVVLRHALGDDVDPKKYATTDAVRVLEGLGFTVTRRG